MPTRLALHVSAWGTVYVPSGPHLHVLSWVRLSVPSKAHLFVLIYFTSYIVLTSFLVFYHFFQYLIFFSNIPYTNQKCFGMLRNFAKYYVMLKSASMPPIPPSSYPPIKPARAGKTELRMTRSKSRPRGMTRRILRFSKSLRMAFL